MKRWQKLIESFHFFALSGTSVSAACDSKIDGANAGQLKSSALLTFSDTSCVFVAQHVPLGFPISQTVHRQDVGLLTDAVMTIRGSERHRPGTQTSGCAGIKLTLPVLPTTCARDFC